MLKYFKSPSLYSEILKRILLEEIAQHSQIDPSRKYSKLEPLRSNKKQKINVIKEGKKNKYNASCCNVTQYHETLAYTL